MNTDLMFSSQYDEWETPWDLFKALHSRYGFTLDVCARPETAKLPRFFEPHTNGLLRSWQGESCWMNPPYGRVISKWIKKAYLETRGEACGSSVVCLIPSRTDTAYWHDYCMHAEDIFLVKGRVHFLENGRRREAAPFPSAIVRFSSGIHSPVRFHTITPAGEILIDKHRVS